MFKYGLDTLTVHKIFEILEGKLQTTLTSKAIEKINQNRQYIQKISESDKVVYGVNTGFGPLCSVKISKDETQKLQENLLVTHAVGVGKPVDKQISKIMMICKVHSLCRGFSGVRLELIESILNFIKNDLIPVVPEQGSVGASGDLAPLSHLFLPLIGKGFFWNNEEKIPAIELLKEKKIEPLKLEAKEGLALINGTQFILAQAILGLYKMNYLLDLANLAGAMTLEGYQGCASPFTKKLHDLRAFKGSMYVAKHLRALLKDSDNIDSHKDCDRVQDPYSIRCIPQVHGASKNAFDHLNELVEIEMNSVTDNPIIINENETISGGNFHGQLLAMAIDYASLAASELGNISDRRCYLLLEGKFGLPPCLTNQKAGLNSGFMILQYTTAALASENKSLCFPPSADSIPTSLGQEDHVSMGSISGRKFNQISDNIENILAIELICATQALEFRRPRKFAPLVEHNFSIIRKKVKKLENDRELSDDINQISILVQNRAFKINT